MADNKTPDATSTTFHSQVGYGGDGPRMLGDGTDGSTENYGRIAQVTPYVDQMARYRPAQAYLGIPFDQSVGLDDGTEGSRAFINEAALRRAEQDMGQIGYFIRTLDRTGARNAWGLVRASEESPDAAYPSSDSVNGMLLANALKVNGDGQYTTPKGFFHIPPARGNNTGTYNIMDKIHLLFMQEGAFIFTNAQEQGLNYIVGMEDVEQRQRVENMINGGNYERVQKTVPDPDKPGATQQRDLLIGTIPEGFPGAGEEVTAEIYPLARTRVELHPGANYKTTDGLEHSVAVSLMAKERGNPTSPVGWIAAFDEKGERCELVDQNMTIRLFGMEYVRRKGYAPLPEAEKEEINRIGMGPTIVPMDGVDADETPVHMLVDPSESGLINKSNTWATMYDVMEQLATYGYDPGKTHLSTIARIRDSFNRNKGQVNAVLTGHVVSQMMETFYPLLPEGHEDMQASTVPDEATQKLYQMLIEKVARPEESRTGWQQIAEYLKLEDAQGKSVINSDGDLNPPAVDEHCTSILLSVGVIGLEQMMVQYIIPGSLRYGMDSPYGETLQRIADVIGNPSFTETVLDEARRIEAQHGDIGEGFTFGRQRGECEALLNKVREYTGLSTMIDVIRDNDYDRLRNDPEAQKTLTNMHVLGEIMHHSPLASPALQQGKGINAGVDVIINHYCPELLPEQQLSEREAGSAVPGQSPVLLAGAELDAAERQKGHQR